MNKAFNYRLIFRFFGTLLIVETVALLSSALVALIYHEKDGVFFLVTAGISLLLGLSGVLIGRNASPVIDRREGSLIVTLIWIVFTLIGLLPFWISGWIPSFTDAFFETMSGFTTTGASILNNIEELPHCMLYWRSLTQWIGGLGIIVISIALLPIFGFSAVQLFSAEATGPTKDKIRPKMSDTAKRLLAIYIILTLAQIVLLWIAGMGWFDSVNHAFTTMATGGFSTKQASVGYWDSAAIQYVITFFMFFAGINFTLFYFLVKRNFNRVLQNQELKFFIVLILSVTAMIALSMVDFSKSLTFVQIEKIFRDSIFTVVSIITTTGYGTIDYMQLKPVVWFLLLMVMLIGASAGSTAGGMKVIRVLLVVKYAYYEFKRIIHPNAIFPVRYNQHIVKEDVITRVLAFILLYVMLIALGTIILLFSGMGFIESISSMISCISDVGPALGSLGPIYSYSEIPEFSKWFLSFVMLIGRLEIFTVLVIFTPVFWKN